MKSILITGGAGFIGSHLSHALADKGYLVRVLDNLSPKVHGDSPDVDSYLFNIIKDKNNIQFLHGDVTKRADLLTAIKNVDVIVHFAAETGTGQSMYEIHKYCDVNIGGTSLLFDILANATHQVKKVIIASSRSIYGEGMYLDKNKLPCFPDARTFARLKNGNFSIYDESGTYKLIQTATPECSRPNPVSFYGVTKLFQEQTAFLISKSLGIDTIALRFQNVYGPGQSLKNPYTGLLGVFSNQIRLEKDINIFEDGFESRDFIYIDDAVKATILAIEKKEPVGLALNVGTGTPTSVVRVAIILKKLFKSNAKIRINKDFRMGDIRHNYADNKLIESTFGFKCTVKIEQGLALYVNWVLNEPQVNNEYEKSIDEMISKNIFFEGNKK